MPDDGNLNDGNLYKNKTLTIFTEDSPFVLEKDLKEKYTLFESENKYQLNFGSIFDDDEFTIAFWINILNFGGNSFSLEIPGLLQITIKETFFKCFLNSS